MHMLARGRVWIKKHSDAIWIFLIGFASQIVVFAFLWKLVGTNFPFVSSDSEGYLSIVTGILKTGSVAYDPVYFFDAVRTPGYPMFIALFWKIFGSLTAAIFAQMFFCAFMGVALYKIGMLTIKNRAAVFIGAALFQIELGRAFWSTQLMTDALYAFLFLLSMWIFLKYVNRDYGGDNEGKNYLPLCLGVVLGVSSLVRPIGAAVWIIFCAFYFIFKKRGGAKFIITVFLLHYVIVAPWMLRNYFVYGKFALSSIHANGLYLSATKVYSAATGVGEDTARHSFFKKAMRDLGLPENSPEETWNNLRYADYFYSNGAKILLAHFPSFVKLSLSRVPYYLLNNDYSYEILWKVRKNLHANLVISPVKLATIYWMGRLIWFVIYFVVMAGIVAFWEICKKNWRWLLMFAVFAAYFAAQTVTLDPARYKLTVNPFVLLMFGFAVRNFWVSARAFSKSNSSSPTSAT